MSSVSRTLLLLTLVGLLALAAEAEEVSARRGSLQCPDDKPLVNCFVAPCRVTKCPAFPNANCRDDYCGGCNAKFFMGRREVTKRCGAQNAAI